MKAELAYAALPLCYNTSVMAIIEAFLDDFGSVTVNVSRLYYGGHIDGFYLCNADGYCKDCLIRNVEERETDVRYNLTIPAEYEFGKKYILHESHGQHTVLKNRFIVRSKQFDRLFSYDGEDLGCSYTPSSSSFALWAPTANSVLLKTIEKNTVHVYAMNRTDRGVWRCKVPSDLKHALYVYLVERNGEVVQTVDPYALSSNANSEMSAVIDRSEIESIQDYPLKTVMHSACDAVIYECNVRDMTSSTMSGTAEHGTFAALSQSGTAWKGYPTGLDYLTSLGITHVQLMPVTDFATVDEEHPGRGYNWGYDPIQIISLEGSYSSNPRDPYARMKEFRQLCCRLHERNIRINLDLVLNHMYDVSSAAFDKVLPYYYFRYNESGYLSNGSYCGNDLDSLRPMMRSYFIHAVRTLMQLYGIDGFRFDLMGILDIDTVNAIAACAREIKPDAMIYGEGWNMPTSMPDQLKATIENQGMMDNVGYFNDYFRDVVKGKTSDDQKYDQGYLTGNLNMAFDMCSALSANALTDPYFQRFNSPCKSINALETHDNATVWDKMHACCENETREVRQKRQKMMIACTLFAQGVPFLHQGEEYAGTKADNSNSYNAGDSINGMNYERMVTNRHILEYTKRCIALRREHSAFRLGSSSEMYRRVHFVIVDGSMVTYRMDASEDDPEGLMLCINPSVNMHLLHTEESYEILFDEEGLPQSGSTKEIQVPACSVIVCRSSEDK